MVEKEALRAPVLEMAVRTHCARGEGGEGGRTNKRSSQEPRAGLACCPARCRFQGKYNRRKKEKKQDGLCSKGVTYNESPPDLIHTWYVICIYLYISYHTRLEQKRQARGVISTAGRPLYTKKSVSKSGAMKRARPRFFRVLRIEQPTTGPIQRIDQRAAPTG